MTNVVQFERKPPKNDATTLRDLMDKEDRGELLGQIHIIATEDGDKFFVDGLYADRLEEAEYALIKGLNNVAEKIKAGDGAGYSASPPITAALTKRKKLHPTLLDTGFGELR